MSDQRQEEHDDFDLESEEKAWATYGNFQLVGNGKVTNPDRCGSFSSF